MTDILPMPMAAWRSLQLIPLVGRGTRLEYRLVTRVGKDLGWVSAQQPGRRVGNIAREGLSQKRAWESGEAAAWEWLQRNPQRDRRGWKQLREKRLKVTEQSEQSLHI